MKYLENIIAELKKLHQSVYDLMTKKRQVLSEIRKEADQEKIAALKSDIINNAQQ